MQKTFLFAVSCILKIEENIISHKGAGNWKWNLGVAEERKKGGPTHLYKCVPMKMQGETLE